METSTSTIDHARAVVAAERNAALDRRLQQRLQQEEEDQALAKRLQAALEGANRTTVLPSTSSSLPTSDKVLLLPHAPTSQ